MVSDSLVPVAELWWLVLLVILLLLFFLEMRGKAVGYGGTRGNGRSEG